MNRKYTVLFLLLVFLGACEPEITERAEKPTEPVVQESAEESNKAAVRPLTLDSANLELVIGWLTDQEIAYITRYKSDYQLSLYDIGTAQEKDLYKFSDSIIEARIHPDRERIAIVTSANSLSATIHIVSLAGGKVDELKIESSELYWDWDSRESNNIFFSAFYEDWSFDSFVYFSDSKELNRVETVDPFGKWGINSTIDFINWQAGDELNGGSIRKIDPRSNEYFDTNDQHVIYTESFKEVELKVSISEDMNSFLYTLENQASGKAATYELPSISNYSQWFIPEIKWLTDGGLVTFASHKAGLMDSIPTTLSLIKLSPDSTKETLTVTPYQPFACSPTGSRCLIGTQMEDVLMVDNKEVVPWVETSENEKS